MLHRNVFPQPKQVRAAQPTPHKKIPLKNSSQLLLRRIVRPKKFPSKILHSNCYYDVSFARVRAAQPKIPLKNSPLKIAGTYRSPEFARHNPQTQNFPSKILDSKVQVRIVCPSSPSTTHTTHKKSPQKLQSTATTTYRSTKKFPSKILHLNCIVHKFARHNHTTQKNSPQNSGSSWNLTEGRPESNRRDKLKEIDGRELGLKETFVLAMIWVILDRFS